MSLRELMSSQSDDKLYVEDVFSTYLYTGNGSTQTITNGIDLAGEGGLVWMKDRGSAANHYLCHSSTSTLFSNTTAAASVNNATFLSNGFTDTRYAANGSSQVAFSFRKAPKFFDIVTYTGNGVAGRQIPHNLGCEVGMIVVKNITNAVAWKVYHRSLGNTGSLILNETGPVINASYPWNNTTPTDTTFTLNETGYENALGSQYVAYLFAHDPSAD